MKILFIVNLLLKRGAEQQLFDVIKAMPGNFEIHVFKFSDPDRRFTEFINYKKITMHSNTHSGRYNFLKAFPLLKCMLNEKFDAIITVGTGAALFIGRIAAVLTGVQIIYSELHTFINFNRKSNQYFEFANCILNYIFPKLPGKRIYKFLPVCSKLTEKIRKTVPEYPAKTLKFHLAINESK